MRTLVLCKSLEDIIGCFHLPLKMVAFVFAFFLSSVCAFGMPNIIVPNKPIQEQISIANQQYIVCEPINLYGKTIKLPAGITLIFIGNGSFNNGKIIGNQTIIEADNREIFFHGESSYRGYKTNADGYKYISNNGNGVEILGTWNNIICKSNWTGLESLLNDECASLSINNFIRLHKENSPIAIPHRDYYVYSTISNNSHSVDFCNSRIYVIDYSKVEDVSLAIPEHSQPIKLKHPGDILRISGDSILISNLLIDGRSNITGECASKLGMEHSIRISNCYHSKLVNIQLLNAIDCGVAMNASSRDVVFENVEWNNIGEHGVYTHSEQGKLSFQNCRFINCGQSKIINQLRNGYSACVRPRLNDNEKIKDRTLVLDFSNCLFSNSGEIKVMTCYGGAAECNFSHCSWVGGVLGYTENTGLPEALGHCIPYRFIFCTNPPSRYSGYDTKRYLYNCTNVTNLFEDTFIAENCSCMLNYSDVYNKYSESFNLAVLKDTTYIRNCRIVSHKPNNNLKPRIKIHNPHPIVFDSCEINLDSSHLAGQHFYMISLVDDSSNDVAGCGKLIISNCDIDMGGLHFMNIVDSSIDIRNSNIYGYYKFFINGNRKTNTLSSNNLQYHLLISNSKK